MMPPGPAPERPETPPTTDHRRNAANGGGTSDGTSEGRDVDMVPAVRAVLWALPTREVDGIVFPRADGRMFNRGAMEKAWHRTLKATGVRKIRPYDLRHTYASLLIAAGKNPLYIARQMGHHSAGFTLDTYGHLMETLPHRQVESIDELVFPEGWETGRVRDRRAVRSQAWQQFSPIHLRRWLAGRCCPATSPSFPTPSHRTVRAVLPHTALGPSSRQAHEVTTL